MMADQRIPRLRFVNACMREYLLHSRKLNSYLRINEPGVSEVMGRARKEGFEKANYL